MIYYPTFGRVGELNSLQKGRFVVKDEEGQQRLVLAEAIRTMSTTGLLAQAANDYNSLLPNIAATSVPEGSKLVLKRLDSNDRCMHVVCPPEGWGTLYIAVRQADRMYCSDTVLTYGFTGTGYMLLECTTAHYYKGE
jgi:putative heme iron utilization protein